MNAQVSAGIGGDDLHARRVVEAAKLGGSAVAEETPAQRNTRDWRSAIDATNRQTDEEERAYREGDRKAQERRASLLKKIAGLPGQSIYNGASLMATEFADPVWTVERIITEGFSLLAGAPKSGKSWMALHLAYAVSSGGRALGQLTVSACEVLYLALEDSARRLKARFEKMHATPSGALELVTKWLSGSEGLEALDAYLTEHPAVKLVLIDTLGRLLHLDDGNSYAEVYEAGTKIKSIADAHHIALIGLHHSGKAPRADWAANVLGSTGYTGAADTILLLGRIRGRADALLQATGRDLEDQELGLTFDPDVGTWSLMDDQTDARQTEERAAVLAYLRDNGPARSGRIADALKKSPSAISYLLAKLKDDGEVSNPSYGLWKVVNTPQSPQTPQSTKTPETDSLRTSRTLRGSDGRAAI